MKKEETKEVPVKIHDNSFGVAAVVLGIFSIIFASINGIILGVVALVFANKQKKIMHNKWARSGKIISIIGILISLALVAVNFWAMKNNPQLFSQLIQ